PPQTAVSLHFAYALWLGKAKSIDTKNARGNIGITSTLCRGATKISAECLTRSLQSSRPANGAGGSRAMFRRPRPCPHRANGCPPAGNGVMTPAARLRSVEKAPTGNRRRFFISVRGNALVLH